MTLGIIMDGFSAYNPVIHKKSGAITRIKGFSKYPAGHADVDEDYIYVCAAGDAFGENCPKHLVVSGKIDPKNLPEKADTLIQIPGGIPAEVLVREGQALLNAYNEWYNSLLMAIIEHMSIDAFLELAAQKLANPIVLYNYMSVICTAGSISRATEDTVWEKINMPGFTLDNFYTPKEIYVISTHIARKNEQPILIDPENDPAHALLVVNIFVDGKFCGGIALVDINEPFTEGQKEILAIAAQLIKQYFRNHSVYMQMAENKENLVNSLLNGADISAEIISNYLNRFQWRLDDHFCIVTFSTSADLRLPIESVLDVRQIGSQFPEALVTVYEECVVVIMRCADRRQPHGKNKQLLEQFLKKDIILCCGVSMVFNNFMYIGYYYIQSRFAAARCKQSLNPTFSLYQDYQAEHVLETLSSVNDPRCFCHPGILSLWESGEESKRALVYCLHQYFLNGKNISASADALNIHRNTLIYRLNKAQEMLCIDIKLLSPEQSFLFIMSCLIVQYLL